MTTFFEAVEVEDDVDRRDVVDGLFLIVPGLNFELSEVEDTARLTCEAGEAFDALEGGLDLGSLGEFVPTVLLLAVDMVEAADCLRERAEVLGGSSDLALSNAVEPLLVVDTEDVGRERPEVDRETVDVGRSVEGPATDFRKVEAWEVVDLTDAALDLGRDSGARELAVWRRATEL